MMEDLALPLQARLALGSGTVPKPNPTKNVEAANKAAEEFEAVFLTELLGAMFEGIKTDGPLGGGPGEEMFRSLLLEQYALTIARQGGIGLADGVKRELLNLQEVAQ